MTDQHSDQPQDTESPAPAGSAEAAEATETAEAEESTEAADSVGASDDSVPDPPRRIVTMLRALRALRLGWLLAVGAMVVLFLVYQSGMMDPDDAMKSVGGFIGGLAVLIWIAGYFKWRENARSALKSYPTSPRALVRKTVLFQPLCFLVFSGGFAVVLLRLWYVQLRSTSVSVDQLLTLAVGALGLGLLAATDLLVRATRATYFPPPQKQHLRARREVCGGFGCPASRGAPSSARSFSSSFRRSPSGQRPRSHTWLQAGSRRRPLRVSTPLRFRHCPGPSPRRRPGLRTSTTWRRWWPVLPGRSS